MIIEATATGKTVDEAVEAACKELGREREEVEIEILELPRRGFLGLTHIPAKVRAYMEIEEKVSTAVEEKKPAPAAPANTFRKPEEKIKPKKVNTEVKEKIKPEVKEEPKEKKIDTSDDRGREIPMTERGNAAFSYVKSIVSLMGIENVEIEAKQYEKAVVIKITGEGAGGAIGRRGETLDSLQYLAGLCANRMEGDYCRVILDAGNYRQKRKQTLQQLAKRLASNVVKTGRPITLEPMNPYERRIIHATVSEIKGASSTSVGDEPTRCVVISCDGAPAGMARNGGRPPRGNGGRKNYRNDKRNGQRREKPQPYKETSVREVAPKEAEDKPLYGKIEL